MIRKKIMLGGLVLLFLTVPLLAAPFLQPQKGWEFDSASMKPHRALYEVTLASIKGGQLVDIQGKMYFEGKQTCDGWATDHRSTLMYEYADGTSARIHSNFVSYETLDGKNLNFSARRANNGVPFEEFRGHASLDANADGAAVYTIPGDVNMALPKNTFFPMQHTAEILKRARRGEKFFNASLFDGSDAQGSQQVNVFIGDRVDASAGVRGANIDAALLQVPAHSIRLAFFPNDDDAAADTGAADYEMDMVALDNGVVSDIKIIYDTFTITQKLVALESVPMPVCSDNSTLGGAPTLQ